MRDQVKSGNKAQGAQTTVPSTTQTTVTYKYLGKTTLLRVGFSEHPETYLVNISGTTLDDHKVEVSRVYDELHPLMAIGRAVTEFYDSYVCGRIGSIIIKQRVVK